MPKDSELYYFYYFLFIAIAIIYTIGLYFILRKKSDKTKKIVVYCLIVSNFILHFVKMLTPGYSDFWGSFHKMTPENICAISVLISPFIFLINKKSPIHDFMYFVCLLGGVAALIDPTEAVRQPKINFEVIRFYYCHITLLTTAVLTATLGIHKPKFKNVWIIPLGFLVYELIIYLDNLLLFNLDLLSAKTWDELNCTYGNNNSFTFGVTPEMYDGFFGKLFRYITPNFLKRDIYAYDTLYHCCVPVIWLTIPVCLLMPPIYCLFSFPFWINNKKKIFEKA